MDKFFNISQLSRKLNLIDQKTKKPRNHIIRYWEKEFKQIRPKIINKHRYYNDKHVEIFKFIIFLLRNKGMTIKGVKNVLNLKINKLDDYNSHSLKTDYFKKKFKEKSLKIIQRINKIKRYGKKNTH